MYENTLQSARDLLGKRLCHRVGGEVLCGRIVETEAYLSDDPACHAFRGQTPRNIWMFGKPGTAYIYLNYGIHYCMNVVTNIEGIGEAVLIRALEPVQGITKMQELRGKDDLKNLTSGPGKLTQALAIDTRQNGVDLSGESLWIENDLIVSDQDIVVTTRVGITRGSDLLYRFYIKGNEFVSRK